MRVLWLLIAAVLAVAVSVLAKIDATAIWAIVSDAEPGQPNVVNLGQYSGFQWTLGIALGGLAFVLLGLLLPVVVDAFAARNAISNLEHLASGRRRAALKPKDLVAAFDHNESLREGVLSIVGRQSTSASDDGEKKVGALKPVVTDLQKRQLSREDIRGTARLSDVFCDTNMVDRPLAVGVFNALPGVLLGLALLFVAQLFAQGAVIAGLSALAIAGFGAMGCFAISLGAVRQRRLQNEQLRTLLGSFLPTGSDASANLLLIERLEDTNRHLSARLDTLNSDLSKALEKTTRAVKHAGMGTAEATAAAVDAALNKSLSQITTAAMENSQRQADEIDRVAQSVVDSFSKGMDKHLSSSMKNLTDLARAAASAADKAEKSFSDATRALSEVTTKSAQTANQDFSKASDELAKAIKAELKEITKALDKQARALDQSRKTSADAFTKMLEPASQKLLDVLGSLEELQKTVSDLTSSMPAMLDAQKQTLAALENDQTASKTIGRAADELNQAAQASRDAVENFIELAERLRAIGRDLQASIGAVPVASKAPAKQPTDERPADLSSAVKELRDIASGDLPEFN